MISFRETKYIRINDKVQIILVLIFKFILSYLPFELFCKFADNLLMILQRSMNRDSETFTILSL